MLNTFLSLHYPKKDTPYDPYGPQGDAMSLRQFRPIGINHVQVKRYFCKCVITKSNGEQATVVSGDINFYKYALIVELENHDVRVVDRENLTPLKANPHENLGNHKKIQ